MCLLLYFLCYLLFFFVTFRFISWHTFTFIYIFLRHYYFECYLCMYFLLVGPLFLRLGSSPGLVSHLSIFLPHNCFHFFFYNVRLFRFSYPPPPPLPVITFYLSSSSSLTFPPTRSSFPSSFPPLPSPISSSTNVAAAPRYLLGGRTLGFARQPTRRRRRKSEKN